MDKIQDLEQRIAKLEKLLIMKVLGNDTSTNYGLPAQTILYGLQQAGTLSLTKAGVRTSINNTVDPDLGETVSLESEDVSISNGDKSAVTPNAFVILAWDGAAYQAIASIGESGSEGNITLNDFGTAVIVLQANATPFISVTDGVKTSILSPVGLIVDNGVGIDAGPVLLTGRTATFVKGILTSLI